jgi:hypothetical protein
MVVLRGLILLLSRMHINTDPAGTSNNTDDTLNISAGTPEDLKTEEVTIPEHLINKIPSSTLRNAHLVMIEREDPARFELLSSTLDFNLGGTLSATLRVKQIESDADSLLKKLKGSQDQRAILAEEIRWQSELMARIENTDKIRVFLEFVLPIRNKLGTPSDGFHVDAAHRRILCTYVGPGTEWIRNSSIDPSVIKSRISVGMAKVISSPNWLLPESDILQVPTGQVVIAKSNEWVHRRPYSKVSRLFMTIDPA